MTANKHSRPPARAALVKAVIAALEDMKAVNIKVIDVRDVTDVAECMVIASGNSDRHVRSIADRVVERSKQAGFRPASLEGQDDAEWVLVDLNDVIVHVMLPRVREYYALESLWDVRPPARKSAPRKAAKKAAKKAANKAVAKAPVKRKAPAKRPAAKAAKTPARKTASPRRKSA